MTTIEILQARSIPEPNTGCWLWLSGISSCGYGTFKVGGRSAKAKSAHRVSYEAYVGPIPAGLVIDHKCRVRACINPDHLRAVTLKENILCGTAPSARHAVATHCLRGHAFDAANTFVYKNRRTGGVHRVCRACGRLHDARRA